MGSTKSYDPQGGFSKREYKAAGTSAGMKVITRKDGQAGQTPLFSNTAGTAYVFNNKAGEHTQIAVYGSDRRRMKDIDWGHPHVNVKTGKRKPLRFGKDEIHVQEFGSGIRKSGQARRPSKKERRQAIMVRSGRFG